MVEKVSDQVKEQLEDLKEVVEGDTQPERKTAAQGVEQTSVLERYIEEKVISSGYSTSKS